MRTVQPFHQTNRLIDAFRYERYVQLRSATLNDVSHSDDGDVSPTRTSVNRRLDDADRRIMVELDRDPRMSAMLLAERTGMARGTVHAHLDHLEEGGMLRPHSARLKPPAVGLGLRAIVMAEVGQDEFDDAIDALAAIPEVVECAGISGRDDLHMQIVGRDPDHIYLITQRIMRCPGVKRTSTSIVLREFIAYRTMQLLDPA